MDTTLVILAAGLGTRYGKGIKQLAKMDNNENTLMDYSIYDAIKAGFNKVVFIIREDIEEEFMEVIGNRIKENVKIELAYQNIEDLPEGFTKPEGRTKPWGTVQALMSIKGIVKEPFLIINADDYYGKEAFSFMHDYLVKNKESNKLQLGMVGYKLKNTISDNGTVNRGVCIVNEDNKLEKIMETHEIIDNGDKISSKENLSSDVLNLDSVVSMNLWAAYPEFIDYCEEFFKGFLKNNIDDLKSEYVLSDMIDEMLRKDVVEVTVIPTKEKWIGITYHEDLKPAKESFKQMIDDGIYPEDIWGK